MLCAFKMQLYQPYSVKLQTSQKVFPGTCSGARRVLRNIIWLVIDEELDGTRAALRRHSCGTQAALERH